MSNILIIPILTPILTISLVIYINLKTTPSKLYVSVAEMLDPQHDMVESFESQGYESLPQQDGSNFIEPPTQHVPQTPQFPKEF